MARPYYQAKLFNGPLKGLFRVLGRLAQEETNDEGSTCVAVPETLDSEGASGFTWIGRLLFGHESSDQPATMFIVHLQ